ncbi:hypothetical protein NQ317_019133 [Molorchus minor]|uniref:Peptidase aspartic putative domain-containing protein n=1 Tax=Molorchus minor TaxID=1323400 RepID=A0ABQ9JIV7_9CUCU|nr:hypothetical protein NQ317_019133 [Molorchus minor]
MALNESVITELRSLVHKRGLLKASLTRFENFLTRPDLGQRILELQTRLAAIETIFSEFDDIQSRIELISETDDAAIAYEDEAQTHGSTEHDDDENQQVSVSTHSSSQGKGEILLSTLLSTALINLEDKFGKSQTCRVLLDSGSQSNFIRANLCNELQLNKESISIPVTGISQIATNISHKTNAIIQSRFNGFKIELPFLVLDEITEKLPISKINPERLQIPNNIILADPTFHTPGQIDLLIGAGTFFELLTIVQIKLGDNLPVLQKTKLGWVVSGNVPFEAMRNTNRSLVSKRQATICNRKPNRKILAVRKCRSRLAPLQGGIGV